jgi:hypothetical protein
VLAAELLEHIFTGPYDDLSAIARDDHDPARPRQRHHPIPGRPAHPVGRDAQGIYNPYNPASPLVIGGNLDTDKPIRVSAILAGVTYPLYYGFITDIEGDPSGRGTVQITAVDFLDKLDRQSPS